MNRWLMMALIGLGCGSKDDSSSGPPGVGPAPDVTGRYNVQISAATGCEGESYWLEEWVPGPLTVSGTPDNLSFDWGSDIVLGGAVDGNKNYSFAGSAHVTFVLDDTGASQVEADLEIFNAGSFEKLDGCWEMNGTFEVVVDEDGFEATNCTLSGPIKGRQLEGSSCNGLL